MLDCFARRAQRLANACSSSSARPRERLVAATGALLFLTLLAAGCGVSFGADSDETEIFEALRIEGDLAPSASLRLKLDYKSQYPVAVIVGCRVLRDGEGKRGERVVAEILTEAIPANTNGGPVGEATPEAGSLERAFIAPGQPGRYLVECYTVDDDNNAIEEEMRIRLGAD